MPIDRRLPRTVAARVTQMLTDLRTLAGGAVGSLTRVPDAYDGLRYIDADDGQQPTYLLLPSEGRIAEAVAGSVSARRFVRPGDASVSAGVNAALAYSAANNVEVVFVDDLTVTSTIVVPEGAKFRCSGKAKLRPNGDFTVMRLPARAIRGEVRVDLTALAAYSSIAVEVDGSSGQFRQLQMGLIEVTGLTTFAATATGVALRSNGGYVAGVLIDELRVNYMPVGYICHSNSATTGNNGYVNENIVRKGIFVGCVYNFDFYHELGTEVSTNKILDLTVQPTAGVTKRAIRGRGVKLLGNEAAGTIYDWGDAALDNGERLAIEMPRTPGASTSGNVVASNLFRFPALDSLYVRVNERDVFQGSSTTLPVRTFQHALPSSLTNRSLVGNQDDALAWVDSWGAVTFTGVAPNGTNPATNAFRVPDDSRAYWPTLASTDQLVYLIDTKASYSYWTMLGLHFDFALYPRSVKIESSTDAVTWTVQMDVTDNDRQMVVWQHPAATGNTTARYWRITLSNSPAANGALSLARIYARCGGIGGRAFKPYVATPDPVTAIYPNSTRTLATTDRLVLATSGGAAVTLTLPDPAAILGQTIVVSRIDSTAAGSVAVALPAGVTWREATTAAVPIPTDGYVAFYAASATRYYRLGSAPLRGVFTVDFPSVPAQGQVTQNVTLTGAVAGDVVQLGRPAGLEAGLIVNAYVTANSTVTLRCSNITAAAIDPASASYTVSISR